MISYNYNPNATLSISREQSIDTLHIKDAVERYNKIIDQISRFEVDIFSILGMRNLSSFVGEVFATSIASSSNGMFIRNPHQDGYPDLLLMDDYGNKLMRNLENRMREKKPFSPFEGGGIEVKATCGSVPTQKICENRGFTKPGIGDQRIPLMQSYDWKAHHRDTNHLLSIFWDFIDGKPYICAVFYSDSISTSDWGNIVQPRVGGGRTTSVSIMNRNGVKRMYTNWIAVINDNKYIDFFNKYNRDSLIPRYDDPEEIFP